MLTSEKFEELQCRTVKQRAVEINHDTVEGTEIVSLLGLGGVSWQLDFDKLGNLRSSFNVFCVSRFS